jgi:arylsulfatase A-like enzyme
MHRRAAAVLASSLVLGACGEEPAEKGKAEAPGAWPVRVERPAEERHQYDRVVLVTIDTLRADHVSCYGYPRRTTPFLDSLAARGARFTSAMASFSCTAPSHATMLTGLVPVVHGVLRNGAELDPAALDLAELFAGAGFESAAIVNVRFLSAIAGSFGHVEVRAVGRDKHGASGADVVDAALAWLENVRKGERFFLWVHLYDVHEWQRAVLEHGADPRPIWGGATPDGFLARVAELHGLPAPEPGKPYAVLWDAKQSREPTGFWRPERYPSCIDAYDERILFADRQIERLYERIEALALPGRTLWVVTSDHGEGLASHAVAGHGPRIYQEQLHVPLVLHASDGSLAPRVVDELVAHVDLFPTLAETLGLGVSGDPQLYDRRSLWPLVRGESAAWTRRPVFSQRCEDPASRDRDEVYALQDGRKKFILHVPVPGAARFAADEFYDLASDPRELLDLGAGHAQAAGLRAALEERLRLYRGLARPHAELQLSGESMQELRDLGYAQ